MPSRARIAWMTGTKFSVTVPSDDVWTTWLSSFRTRIAASWARRTACSNRSANRSLSTKVTTRSWMKPSIAFGQRHGEDAGPVRERVGEEGPQIEGAGDLPRQRVAERRLDGRILGERRNPVREPCGRQEVPASPDADDRCDQAHAGEEHQQTGEHTSEAAVLCAGRRLLFARARHRRGSDAGRRHPRRGDAGRPGPGRSSTVTESVHLLEVPKPHGHTDRLEVPFTHRRR